MYTYIHCVSDPQNKKKKYIVTDFPLLKKIGCCKPHAMVADNLEATKGERAAGMLGTILTYADVY
jgi:hypothetical protein